jgi:protein phosphatase 2C
MRAVADSSLLVAVQVANYCRERLQVLLRQELRLLGKDLGETSEVEMKEHWDDLFTRCFQRLDDEVSGQASRLVGGVQESRPVAAENVGSTAVVAVVCSSHVVVANCGDSRVVLCRGKEPVELSIDHKVSFFFSWSHDAYGVHSCDVIDLWLLQPDRKDERARIEALGGKVIQWNGYRVSGILAMSRSIGMYIGSSARSW